MSVNAWIHEISGVGTDNPLVLLVDTAAVVTSNDVNAQSAEITYDTTAAETPTASDDDTDDTATLRSRLLSTCEQVMAQAAICDDSTALQQAVEHMQTAEATLRTTANDELHFISTKKKRQATVTKAQKPSADKVNAVKRALMTVSNNTTYSACTDILSTGGTYDAALYCVNTEEVMTS